MVAAQCMMCDSIKRDVSHGMCLQANNFKQSTNDTISIIETAVPKDGTVDTTELKNAQKLLGDAEKELMKTEKEVRYATERFHSVIIVIGVLAIICAILGLLCVFVRVRYVCFCCLHVTAGHQLRLCASTAHTASAAGQT